MTLRIANAAGFLGDQLAAPRRLVEAERVDYLTLEYLAELTLSILAAQRSKNPQAGFAGDFLHVLEQLAPSLIQQPQLRIVTNAGGVNPLQCGRRAAGLLRAAGVDDCPVAVVTGDDLLSDLPRLRRQSPLCNLDDGRALETLEAPIVSANAYLGCDGIVEALDQGARLVITGRVADASLTVGPAAHHFGWSADDWDRRASAAVAGHVIECGAQATGGYMTDWQSMRLVDVGYPIAELHNDGGAIITQPTGSGGLVNRQTVTEQLVYEIGDPQAYLTPDVVADFTTIRLDEIGSNRVQLSGATGRAAPDSYKVSMAYQDGYMASGQLLVYGRDCVAKARACADIVLKRLEKEAARPADWLVELLGTGDGVPGCGRAVEAETASTQPVEVILRMAVRDPELQIVQRFSEAIAPLITSGPAGLAGYATGRPRPRRVLAYWPTLVPRALIQHHVELVR